MNKKKVSNCCWRPDRLVSEEGPTFSDIGLCPQCKEHCEFVLELNDATRKAIEDVRAGRGKRFDTAEALFEDLDIDPPCGALAPTRTG